MSKYLGLFLFLIMAIVGCKNQPVMLLQGALTNAVSPKTYTAYGSDKKYSSLLTATDQARQDHVPDRSESNDALICRENSEDDFSNIFRLTEKIRDLACSCYPWGSCAKDVCSCDILCPIGMDIFDRGVITPDNVTNNSLAFTNNQAGKGTYGYRPNAPKAPIPFLFVDEEEKERLKEEASNNLLSPPSEVQNQKKVNLKPKNIFSYNGFCWGHADLTQKFNRLAFFQNNSPKKFQDNPKERTKYYREIINKIINNEPAEIEGFANLNEFSADPEIQEYLIKKVGDLWKRNAASYQGVKSVFAKKPPVPPTEVIADLTERIQNHQQPQMLFHIEGMGAHVVLVNNIATTEDGGKIICVRDNNYLPAEGPCPTGIVINEKGAFYNTPSGMKTIRTFQVAHNENAEVVEQQKNLAEKCSKEKNCNSKK